jgi:mannose-6-phosphate isomerase-like protein (cupin superfamily)
MTSTTTTTPSAVLSKDEGVADLWWPYGPSVGRYTFKTTGEQTQGSLIQVLIRDSEGAATPLHIHHDADETFYVLEGEVTIVVGDERIEAKTGDFVLGPRGVPHAFLITSERAELLVTFGPAGREGSSGSGFEGFIREVAIPVDGGNAPQPTMPDAEEFARLMSLYGIELVGPPPVAAPGVADPDPAA